MEINVEGKIRNIELIYGLNDNQAQDWTYETLNSISNDKDDDGRFMISQRQWLRLNQINQELKKKRSYGFELPEKWDLDYMLKKMIFENDEEVDRIYKKCKTLAKQFIDNDCFILSADMVEVLRCIFRQEVVSKENFIREPDIHWRTKEMNEIRDFLIKWGCY